MQQTHTARKPENMLKDGVKLAPFTRALVLQRQQNADGAASTVPGLDVDTRTLTFSFSSEQPVQRWFGNEVLSHDKGAGDFTRLNDAAPLLFNHNMDDVIGVVERAWINGDKKGECTVRFARTARGDEVMGMVLDGILRNVSFMYQALAYRIESNDEDPYYDDDAVYTATKWLAYEVSLVSVPADQTIGIGRAAATQERSVSVETRKPGANVRASGITPTERKHPMDLKDDASVAERSAAVATATDAAQKAERQRVDDIVALGRKHALPMEKVHDMITRGIDIALARGEILDAILTKGQQPVANLGGRAEPDLTEREKRSYSFIRAVGACITKDWGGAGFEREVSNEIAKMNKRDGTTGFFMPTTLPFAPDEKHLRAWQMLNSQRSRREMQTRAPYSVGPAIQGGNLVQTQLLYDNFIEVLRNMMVTPLLGARFLTGLTGNIDIPRQTAQTGTYWVAESGAMTEGEATFDKVSLRPKTIGALSKMSRLMLLQATPAIEMIAREDLLQVMARGIDISAISGSGASNQPTGIVNQSGVNSVVGGTNGAALTFDHIIALKYAIKVANAPQSALGFAINSKSVGYLSTQKASTGQYLWDPQGGLMNNTPDTLKGSQYAESQQLRSTLTKGTSSGICSEIVYGNWQELLIAEWGVTEILVNPYDSTGFANGDVLIRALQTLDIGVRHGGSFAVMSDVLTPGF